LTGSCASAIADKAANKNVKVDIEELVYADGVR
jgi:hypothetical protein